MPGKGFRYNPKFFGAGGNCPLGGVLTSLDTLANASTSSQFATPDSSNMIWISVVDKNQANVITNYGTYDTDGIMVKTGASGTIATATVNFPTKNIVLDTALGVWFLVETLNKRLIYGTYSGTGLVTLVGNISLGGTDDPADITLDTVNRLWFVGSAAIDEGHYGSYTAGGVPTKNGNITTAGLISRPIACETVLNKIFFVDRSSGDMYTADYNTSTGAVSAFSLAQSSLQLPIASMRIDPDKRVVFYNTAAGNIATYRYNSGATSFSLAGNGATSETMGDLDIENSIAFTGTTAQLATYRYC